MKNTIFVLLALCLFACKKPSHTALTPTTFAAAYYDFTANADSLGIVFGKTYTLASLDSGFDLFYPKDSISGLQTYGSIGVEHKWAFPSDSIVFNSDSTVTETFHSMYYCRDTPWTHPFFFIMYTSLNTRVWHVHTVGDSLRNFYTIKREEPNEVVDTFYNNNFYEITGQTCGMRRRNDTIFLSGWRQYYFKL